MQNEYSVFPVITGTSSKACGLRFWCKTGSFALIATFLISVSPTKGDSDLGYVIQEHLLLKLDKKDKPFLVEISSDLASIAVAIKRGRKRYVWTEALGRSAKYERIHGLQFSPNGQRVAFMAEKKRRYYMIVDGKEYGPYNTLYADSVIFSPDSRRFAFLAGYKPSADAREDFFAIVDGRRRGKYAGLAMVEPTFSPNGNHVAYIASERGSHYAVIDGLPGQRFPITGNGPHYSLMHGDFIFMGARNDTAYLVIGDSLAGAFYDVIEIAASPTTPDFAYTVQITDTSLRTVFLNDRPMTQYHASKDPRFSPDGQRIAYWASDGQDQFAVVDSLEGPRFDAISDVRFSPDSKHHYYMVFHQMSPRRWSYVMDDVLMPEMTGTLSQPNIYFSPVGSRYAIAYDADTNDQRVIIDGNEMSGFKWVGSIVFDSKGERAGFLGQRSDAEGYFVYVDGTFFDYKDVVGSNVCFSPNSQDVFYWINRSDSRALYANHIEIIEYRSTFPYELNFNSTCAIVFYAVKEDGIYRVTVSKGR